MRAADEVRWIRQALNNYPLSPVERRFVQGQLAVRRNYALLSALHVLRRRQENTLKEIMYLFRDDPVCAASWCVALPRVLYKALGETGGQEG